MGAVVLRQIPDPDTAAAVTGHYLPLIRMNNHIINRTSMVITSLYPSGSRLPNLNRPVFRGGDHPFAFAVESDAGDVVGVSFECEDWIWVCGFDVVELDVGVGGGREEALVGGDAEAVDLRVGVLDCAGADA